MPKVTQPGFPRGTQLGFLRDAAGLSEGRSEGEAIGLEKGAAQKQREIAKVMKEKNISNTEISEITGLSAEDVDKL